MLVVCILSIVAQAQIGGTVLAFQTSGQGFFIAADSRAVHDGGADPDDRHCKIAAIDSDTVFAVAGANAYQGSPRDFVPSWDAVEEARNAINAIARSALFAQE